MRRELLRLGIVLGMIVVAFGAALFVLNTTLYSAGGFVRGYLDTLARKDAAGALTMIGPVDESLGSSELLDADALGTLTDLRELGDDDAGAGVRRVTFGYTADGVPGESAFEVRQTGTMLGLFPTWEFVTAPLSVLQVTPVNDARFAADGIRLTASAPNATAPFLVFTPSTVRLTHESTYLQAEPVQATATDPGGVVPAGLTMRPNAAFVRAAQQEIDRYLDTTCTPQKVLMPTGCPFGQQISNRVASEPAWSMVDYPAISLVPGPEPGTWSIPRTAATARLVVDVRSLFDGTVTTFDEAVPFTVSYLVTIGPGDALTLTAQY